MSASIDEIITTAATHLLMVKRHTPEQVADYLIHMADRTSEIVEEERARMWGARERWAGAHAHLAENESLSTK